KGIRRPMIPRLPLFLLATGTVTLGAFPADAQSPGAEGASPNAIDAVAERYVRVALAFDEIDDSYVDAFSGPDAWLEEAAAGNAPLERLQRNAGALRAELARVDTSRLDDVERLRLSSLDKRIEA